MKLSELRNLIKLIIEAPEDDDENDPKPTKTAEKDYSDFKMPRGAAPLASKEKAKDITGPEKQKEPDEGPISRKGPSIDMFKDAGEFSVPAHDPGEGFDFDTAFDAALMMGYQARDAYGLEDEEDVGVPTDQQTMLPTQALAKAAGHDLAKPIRYSSAKAEAMSILMDEMYAPAMHVGQRLLPSVFAELGRMAAQDQEMFKRTFAASLAKIREVENAWFAGILGESPPQPGQMPSGDEKEHQMLDKMLHVLDRYFSTVLKSAAKNAHNLLKRTEDLKKRIGDEEFKQAFFEALAETRDVEDQAFKQFLGGMRGLPAGRGRR